MLEINRGLYDFNYYYLYLLQYLRSNKYEVDNDHPQLQANSIAALDAFEEARRNGATVTMAEEEAIRVLFTNIGESEYNIVSELILENFGDTIDLDSTEAVEYWTNQVMTDIPDLFDGLDRMAIGLDPLDLSIMENEIVGKIVIYLSDNGLQ
ncbi:DUF1896 family protein [uncultured Duncaniella sp.]|jgi:hypothetical protein|uniref:DUF1896 family protein n=1 Tax=Duncaniella dubosii TaxID=2518971 RepID=UPI0026774A44|nr:DUF1896 family protein [uncultured Duncaniella sp.]